MPKIDFDPSDDALRDVVRYELTKVSGDLEYRVTHLINALKSRAMLMQKWDKRVGKTGRAGR